MVQISRSAMLRVNARLTVRPSAFLNGITYVQPKVPTLYTALSTSGFANNAAVYGTNTHAYVLKKNQVIEIVLNSDDPGKHPFHLHGHAFQAIVRSDDGAGFYANNGSFPEVPMRRDTFMVRPNSHIVLRFRADNPDKYSTRLNVPPRTDWPFYAFGSSIATLNGTFLAALPRP